MSCVTSSISVPAARAVEAEHELVVLVAVPNEYSSLLR